MPFHLPEVIAADEVFVAEGERDVASLRKWGLTATCNPGGAGKWRDEYSKFLKGKRVVVLQDSDEPGQKHALAVVQSVAPYAAEVRLVGMSSNLQMFAQDCSEEELRAG